MADRIVGAVLVQRELTEPGEQRRIVGPLALGLLAEGACLREATGSEEQIGVVSWFYVVEL
jgi:hypothetical protein